MRATKVLPLFCFSLTFDVDSEDSQHYKSGYTNEAESYGSIDPERINVWRRAFENVAKREGVWYFNTTLNLCKVKAKFLF